MKVLFFANTDWYLYNFRIDLARYLVQQGAEVIMLSPPGEYHDRIEHAGFRWIGIDMDRRSMNPFREAAVLFSLARIFAAEKPDIIHNFTIKSVIYGSIAAKFSRVPNLINAVAGLGFVFTNKGLLARALKPLVRLLLRFALAGDRQRLILQNPDDERLFLRERLVRPGALRLILGSGVNTSRFNDDGRVMNRVPRVLMACRLLWDKGVMDYVEAARKIHRSGRAALFELAGSPDDGNPASVHQQQLEEWREHGDIVPVGHLDNMNEQLKATDIVVLPTRYGEGVPRVLIEAAASGVPLVATDVPGCREIVRDGQTGYKVPPGDADGLARAIQTILDSPDLGREMGRSGRQLVLEEFDERVVFARTLDVYRELVPV